MSPSFWGSGELILAAVALASATPLIAVFSRESPPAIAALVCALLVAAVWSGGRGQSLLRLRDLLLSPGGLLLLAGFGLMGASLIWSPAPARGATFLLQMVGSALVLAPVLGILSSPEFPRPLARRIALWLATALGATAVLIAVYVGLSGPIGKSVGFGGDGYRVNRAAIALALLLSLTLNLLWRTRSRALAWVIGAIGAGSIMASESESAKLILVLSAVVAPAAFLAPRLVHRLAGALVVLAFLATPFAAGRIGELIPQSVHRTVGYSVLTMRAEIWREFAQLYWRRPVFGYGLEASNVIARSSEVADLPDSAKRLLNQSHPHNAPLQIWFELGVVGALIGSALLALAWRAVERVPRSLLPVATTAAVGASAVFFVSHGAWQAWWYCLAGLVAALYVASPESHH